jgi:hypothetical protein
MLGLQDANPASATYGCFDRPFWQYRTLQSFAASTMQQASMALAVAADAPQLAEGIIDTASLRERATAGLAFWAQCQHRSGAFDEWYRHEHSYCATAFTTFGAGEALLRLGGMDAARREAVVAALERAGRWLAVRFNPSVMNQNLAGTAALHNLVLLTGETWAVQARDRMWSRLMMHQDPQEGWFQEYGGADAGYGLLALDLLACLVRRGFEAAQQPAVRLSDHLAALRPASGTIAPRVGSRGTEHAFAFGAEWFAADVPAAAQLAQHLRQEHVAARAASPITVDDRYLGYFYLPQFALAGESAADRPPGPAEPERATIAQAHSGLVLWRRPGGSVTCSLRRQGALVLQRRAQMPIFHVGYGLLAEDRTRWSTCAWNTQAANGLTDNARTLDRLECEALVQQVDARLPLTRMAVPFAIVSEWVLRWPWLAETFHHRLKSRRIGAPRRSGPVRFTRRLIWEQHDRLRVEDVLELVRPATILAVQPTQDIEVHSPSAKASGHGLRTIAWADGAPEKWGRLLSSAGQLRLATTLTLEGEDRPRVREIDPGAGGQ